MLMQQCIYAEHLPKRCIKHHKSFVCTVKNMFLNAGYILWPVFGLHNECGVICMMRKNASCLRNKKRELLVRLTVGNFTYRLNATKLWCLSSSTPEHSETNAENIHAIFMRYNCDNNFYLLFFLVSSKMQARNQLPTLLQHQTRASPAAVAQQQSPPAVIPQIFLEISFVCSLS